METGNAAPTWDEPWRPALLTLLCKTQEICNANGILAWLHGETALAAVRDGEMGDYPTICIDVEDADRFIRAFAMQVAHPGIHVESMRTTPGFPGIGCQVIDENSIDFGIRQMRQRRCNGLFVNVRFALHKPHNPKKAKEVSLLSDLCVVRSKLIGGAGAETPAKRAAALAMLNTVLPSPAASFDKLVSLGSGESADRLIDGRKVPRKLLEETRAVSIEGAQQEFLVPRETERYLSILFGKSWKKRELDLYEEDHAKFRDASHSWSEFERRIEHIDFDAVMKDLRRFGRASDKHEELHSLLMPYVGYLKRTHAHFILRDTYAGREEALRALLEQGELDALEAELSPYIKALGQYKALGLSLRPSEELFDVTLDFLKETGRGDYAKELAKVAREEDSAPKFGSRFEAL